jgi:hypothetical protein
VEADATDLIAFDEGCGEAKLGGADSGSVPPAAAADGD